MSKEVVIGLLIAAAFVGGAVYTMKFVMNPETDWKAFEDVKMGDSIEDIQARFRGRINDISARDEAPLPLQSTFTLAREAGCNRLQVYKSGEATFYFGFKGGFVAWKKSRHDKDD